MRHHPNRSVLLPACHPRVHPRCRRSSDTSPDAISLLRDRPRLPSTGSGLPTVTGGTMPSADFCSAVREDSFALSPPPGHPTDLPQSAGIPSVHRRPIDQAQPMVDGGLHGRVPARPAWSHPSYRVRVPRPAPSFHASFSPHLTATALRFPGPSAPRTPGRVTFSPKHDSMHGTHAPR